MKSKWAFIVSCIVFLFIAIGVMIPKLSLPEEKPNDQTKEKMNAQIRMTFDRGSKLLTQYLNTMERDKAITKTIEWFKSQDNVKNAFIWSKDKNTIQVDFKSGDSRLLRISGRF